MAMKTRLQSRRQTQANCARYRHSNRQQQTRHARDRERRIQSREERDQMQIEVQQLSQ